MEIKVTSNFALPGLEEGEKVFIDRPQCTLRQLLVELTARSEGRVHYINRSTDTVNPINFTIEINGFPNHGSKEDLEAVLNDGDIVAVTLSFIGGG
jgi:hypothetical protein